VTSVILTGKAEYDDEYTSELDLDTVLNRPIQDLDLFMGFLQERMPAVVDTYADVLLAKLPIPPAEFPQIPAIISYFPENLEAFPSLLEAYKAFSLGLLDLQKYAPQVGKGKVTFQFRDYLKSYLIPAFYMAESLLSVAQRKKAVALFKDYIDYRTDRLHEQIIPAVDSIDDMYTLLLSGPRSPLEASYFLTADGKCGCRITRCMWSEVLKEFNSPELAYSVACHYDFHAAPYHNSNFVLTRKSTLIQGAKFCDFCWHDTTASELIEHPGHGFWAGL
jgi:hypothetical protein